MTTDDWRKVCFSDESKFQILDNKASFVRRRVGEKFNPDCIIKTLKHPLSIMVWSVICGKGTGRLYIVQGTMRQDQYKEVLEQKLIPQVLEWFPDGEFIFMQDTAPCHMAKSIKKFLGEKKIPLLDWPGNSPDLNPIENLWELLKREVSLKELVTNKTQLIEKLIEGWHRNPHIKELAQKCIDSMPRRVEAVIAAKDVTNSWNYWRNCSTFCPYSCNDGKYVDKSPCSSNSSFGDLLIISDNVTLKHNLTSKMINVIYEEFVIAFDVYKTNVDQKDILRFCKDDNTCDDFIQVSYADYKLKVTFPNLTFGDYDMNSNSWSTIKILQQYINSSYFYSVVVNGAVAFFANNMLPKLFSNISVYNSDEYNPPEPIKNLYIISKTQVFWSQWGHWSKCNPSGFSNRTRYCKSNKWLNCLGNSTESKTCDTNPCYMKLDGVYLIQDVLMFLNCTSQQASYVNCSANQMFDPAYNKCMDSANYNLNNFCIGKFDSNYRNPWNCHSYISCNYYSSTKMDCPAKLVFYPMIDECVYDNIFQCINIISTESNLFESALTSSLVALIFQSATLEPSFTLESSSTLELSSSLEPSSTLAPAMNLLTLNTVYEPLTPITQSSKIIEWSMWSDCSTTCGKGTRFRNSLNMASNPVIEECNTNSCPEDGNWGNWSISECSTTCGGGNIYFSRSCDNPRPSYNGLGCMGVNIYTEDCSINTVCPVNGNWSNWSSWSLCNQPCEGGIKSRFRVCSEPSPKYGGQLCDGNSTEIIDCSLNSCKKAKLSLSIFFVDELYLITSELKDKINIAISNLYKDFKRTVTFNIVLHSIRDDDL
ncbi:uncharacterized protein LOC136074357 [Hydra vulgaris]|uniref:Uncharacterized protein LOC136074357 n=1 Tax=Hydra vulgaris TaxID=6087 RepID=A0ABM4B1U4_HYDVU